MSESIAHISLRVPASLKDEAQAHIKAQGLTFTDVFKDVLEYIVKEGKMPVKREILSNDDRELLNLVKERLENPGKKIKVSLDELRKDLHIKLS
ncbi:type II toxin-antitoxin system RelB/DinJ family antitoxin [Acetobacter persici]|uniref:type II toxin-antitoxin system RelB/DinJ family antitoxin n=1 Tax=Acetobacter persici TaxID=1076596 RepID=UPI001BA7FC81|nr:type II toxin-antitoxin system RelB/DinJ family antitoxin [Acetobacter persici]MBS1017249.1 type II toxin-antitoxin system RelB/DinJ family antitoxin [Acetobacter persici]